jgi:hypothetical protein
VTACFLAGWYQFIISAARIIFKIVVTKLDDHLLPSFLYQTLHCSIKSFSCLYKCNIVLPVSLVYAFNNLSRKTSYFRSSLSHFFWATIFSQCSILIPLHWDHSCMRLYSRFRAIFLQIIKWSDAWVDDDDFLWVISVHFFVIPPSKLTLFL